MRRVCLAVVALALFPLSALAAEDAVDSLKRSGVVALMRHAEAPGGAGDPPGFKLDDCSTQRNLSERGRLQARAVGERLRQEGVAITRVLTSEWCRCRETARLMNVGDAHDAATFNNAFVLSQRRGELTQGARELISNWNGPGILLIVTHGANILALTGIQPREAELVIVMPEPVSDARIRVLARLPPP